MLVSPARRRSVAKFRRQGIDKIRSVKLFAWFFACFGPCISCAAAAQGIEGNYGIRFEPTATLQTGPPIPFQIMIKDALHKPLVHGKVTLQIADSDSRAVQVFPATEVEPGTYIAKPSFHEAGDWSIYVEVNREGLMSARTIHFQVSD